MTDTSDAYHELYAYTFGRPGFILQHVVDAHMAQTLDAASKPLGVVCALAGLYLRVEKGFSGFDVQRAHKALAERRRDWPKIPLPERRGSLTAVDVLAAPAGVERDAAIDRWCESVWAEFNGSRDVIVRLLTDCKII